MVSDRLLLLVCCPGCRGALERPAPSLLVCTGCGARYPQSSSGYLDVRPVEAFSEQTKYLDEALHADARHETVSPPLLQSGVRQRQLRRFLQLGPDDLVIDLGCGSGRSMLWNAASGATFVGVDVSPYFAREAVARVDLALADLRRLPFRDGAFTKAYALDVLEHLSPEALDGMLAEAARVLQPGGTLFVYSHVRKNAPIAKGLRAINALARWLERAGLIDMTQERLRKSDHLNPLRDLPHLEQVVTRAGFRLARIRYYTPLVGGFVENILMRMAERAMARRARKTIAAPDGDADTAAVREARTAAKARLARGGPVLALLRAVTVIMDADLVLFGRIRSGPFFALLEREAASSPSPQPPAPGPRP
jgi:ubiquinone/menaquinone biosynthesis C-methylase UbiE